MWWGEWETQIPVSLTVEAFHCHATPFFPAHLTAHHWQTCRRGIICGAWQCLSFDRLSVENQSVTHRGWPWCECEWQHRLTTFRLSPRRTCTTQSPPPSGCSWSHWTKAGPRDQRCWLCPQPDWPNGGRLSEPGWCRTPSFSQDTSILHGRHTEAHSDTGLWGIDPPGPRALGRRSPRRGRLMERRRLNVEHWPELYTCCSQNSAVAHSGSNKGDEGRVALSNTCTTFRFQFPLWQNTSPTSTSLSIFSNSKIGLFLYSGDLWGQI